MKQIKPYVNTNEAMQSLDNGGRFYNFQTKAKDGVINKSELGKVGGLLNDKQQMILFLEMSMQSLDQSGRDAVIRKLDETLKSAYQKYKPQALLPSEANTKGIVSSNAIITGIPQLVDLKSDFMGFIMFPIVSGDITTFMMIPLIDQYDVYEIKDETSSETFLIAHVKGSEKIPNKKITIGGVLKELQRSKKSDGSKGMFLEILYHINV